MDDNEDQQQKENDAFHILSFFGTYLQHIFSIDSFDVIGRIETHSPVFTTFAPALFVFILQLFKNIA